MTEDTPASSLRIADFDYPLPDAMIARHPCEPRDACRMLVRHPDASLSHHTFTDLPALLLPGTLMVCNNTRVINARLAFRKPTGARIEIFCLEPVMPTDYNLMFQSKGSCRWACLVGNLKKWKEGTLSMPVPLPDGSLCTLTAAITAPGEANSQIVEFSWTPSTADFATVIEAAGRIPIPPYLNRESEDADSSDYQTVYSKIEGSVAAPTAGLHFTPRVLSMLDACGVQRRELTLHVGAGTFRPVKSQTIGGHTMHSEVFSVSQDLLSRLIEALSKGLPIAAVGTTTVRTLESLPWLGAIVSANPDAPLHLDQWYAYSAPRFHTVDMLRALQAYMHRRGLDTLTASTSIMIAPGYPWQIVSQIVTNFHQPQSTLLLLVASFIQNKGHDASSWRDMYREALAADYRFLSYGDACLLL